ncbi:glycosyltransferase family 2 protein [Salinisphaera sp. USBA-960]|nr:glycosyltransferase family 2 protein [Salifodinibacter halophilus]NNC26577.1 glycosyltransferase family 2 protein [Salifodinibacter halophilus]
MPKVTVVIPMFNRETLIADAIDSVLAQTYSDFELVIVDDASTDNSCERVRSYTDSRIRLVHNEVNRGLPASRNHGIAEARGDYTAFLDSDDRATHDRLAKQVAFLDAHPDHAAVSAWMRWIDEAGNNTGKTKRKAGNWRQIQAEMLFRSPIEVSAAMGRTDILRAYPQREEFIRGEDYDLWSRIAANYKLATLPHILLERRKHTGQSTISKADPEIKRGRLQVFAEQLDAMGIEYSDTDLENHYLLRRMHKAGFWPDRAFIDWTKHWITRLQRTNCHRTRYPEPEFSRVLALFWIKTCARGLTSAGPYVLTQLFSLPVITHAPRGLAAEIRTRLRLTS